MVYHGGACHWIYTNKLQRRILLRSIIKDIVYTPGTYNIFNLLGEKTLHLNYIMQHNLKIFFENKIKKLLLKCFRLHYLISYKLLNNTNSRVVFRIDLKKKNK